MASRATGLDATDTTQDRAPPPESTERLQDGDVNPFDDLGLSSLVRDWSTDLTAMLAEAARAYRKESLRRHPDKGGDRESMERAGRSREILTSPALRTLALTRWGDAAPPPDRIVPPGVFMASRSMQEAMASRSRARTMSTAASREAATEVARQLRQSRAPTIRLSREQRAYYSTASAAERVAVRRDMARQLATASVAGRLRRALARREAELAAASSSGVPYAGPSRGQIKQMAHGWRRAAQRRFLRTLTPVEERDLSEGQERSEPCSTREEWRRYRREQESWSAPAQPTIPRRSRGNVKARKLRRKLKFARRALMVGFGPVHHGPDPPRSASPQPRAASPSEASAPPQPKASAPPQPKAAAPSKSEAPPSPPTFVRDTGGASSSSAQWNPAAGAPAPKPRPPRARARSPLTKLGFPRQSVGSKPPPSPPPKKAPGAAKRMEKSPPTTPPKAASMRPSARPKQPASPKARPSRKEKAKRKPRPSQQKRRARATAAAEPKAAARPKQSASPKAAARPKQSASPTAKRMPKHRGAAPVMRRPAAASSAKPTFPHRRVCMSSQFTRPTCKAKAGWSTEPGATAEPDTERVPATEPAAAHPWSSAGPSGHDGHDKHRRYRDPTRERTRDVPRSDLPDWQCSTCGEPRNWAARTRCRKCQAPKVFDVFSPTGPTVGQVDPPKPSTEEAVYHASDDDDWGNQWPGTPSAQGAEAAGPASSQGGEAAAPASDTTASASSSASQCITCSRPAAAGFRTCCRTCKKTGGTKHGPWCELAHQAAGNDKPGGTPAWGMKHPSVRAKASARTQSPQRPPGMPPTCPARPPGMPPMMPRAGYRYTIESRGGKRMYREMGPIASPMTPPKAGPKVSKSAPPAPPSKPGPPRPTKAPHLHEETD